MRRIARLLAAVATPVLGLGITAASAAAVDPIDTARAMLVLETTAFFSGTSVTYVANAKFVGGLVPNSVVDIKAAGTEFYTDPRGVVLASPVYCHGVSVRFDSNGTATCTASLKSADSIVVSAWDAEAVGVAPGLFTGQCMGTADRAGSTELIIPTC